MASIIENFGRWGVSLVCAFSGLVLYAIYKHRNYVPNLKLSLHTSAPKVIEKSPISQQREPGEWQPVPFDYPSVEPCADDLKDIKPIPYRPFKWGEYHVTMGIRSMVWNEWIEIDNEFVDYHRIRERRIRTRGDTLVKVLPATPGLVNGGHDAAVELVQELAEYLSRRYPATYTIKRGSPQDGSGWYGLPAIKEITLVPVGKTYKVDEEEPMTLAALLVQDDIGIMIEGSDDRYYLQAGAILIPGSWRLQDKIGMHLDDIHISGSVPQFETKLQLSMNRFFRRLPVDKPVTRTNYSFQVVARPDLADPLDPHELAWAHTMKGDEDAAEESSEGGAGGSGGNGNMAVIADLVADGSTPVDPARVRMRVERQTLRRLPRTGAVVFGIRTYVTPLEALAAEPGIPGRLASAIRSWPEDVATYKARPAYESMLGYLDTQHDRQVADGLTLSPDGQ